MAIIAAADALAWGGIYSGFMLGLVGLVLIVYGRRVGRPPWWMAGLAICAVPCLPVAAWAHWLAAGGLWAGAVLASRVL